MLFVYDFEFNLLMVEPQIIKSKWTIYYNNVGIFEAHLPMTSELTELISRNPYIVVKQHGLSAIIVGKELKDELIIYGRTCNWLLSKRITPAYKAGLILAGNLAVQMVENAFYDVDNFILGDRIHGDEINFEKKEGTTLDAVIDCLELSGLGHELRFDEKRKIWEFNLLSGCNNNLTLSESHRNSYDIEISEDIIDLATCGIFEKKTGDGYESTVLNKDPDKIGIYRWEAKLYGTTETEAQIDLEKLCRKRQITMSVNDVYWGKDYNLGDTVTLKIVKGTYRRTEKRRIHGVEICVEQGVYKEQPIFE